MALCSQCDCSFYGEDYLCPRCRVRSGQDWRLLAVYDDEGYNQWGTKYHGICWSCSSEYPSNMYGMGTCMKCRERQPQKP